MRSNALRCADEHAVHEAHALAALGGHSRPRDDDADQVEGIARRQLDELTPWRAPAHLAQRVDCLGEAVLLTHEPSDETPSADLTASFQTSKRPQQLAIRHVERFSRYDVAEHDAVARQKLLGGGLCQLVAWGLSCVVQQRPAPLAAPHGPRSTAQPAVSKLHQAWPSVASAQQLT